MSRFLRRVVVAVTVALLGALLGAAVPAGAATFGRAAASPGDVCMFTAGSPAADRADLTASLDCLNPVTAVTAVLTGNTTVDLTLTETSTANSYQNPDGDPYEYTWSPSAPLTPGQVPFGQYTIGLSITFQDGGTSSGIADLGSGEHALNFQDEPQYSVTTNGTVIGRDYLQTITITGNVQVLDTDGTVVPFSGGAIDLTSSVAPSQQVLADASGNFTMQVSPSARGTLNLTAAANGLATVPYPIQITEVVDPIKLTAKLANKQPSYGSTDLVTGTVTYLPHGGTAYKPLAGTPVIIRSYLKPRVLAKGVTGPNGTFSVKVPVPVNSPAWDVEVGAIAGDSRFTSAYIRQGFSVVMPSAITGLHVTLNPDWTVKFSGCLTLAKSIPGVTVRSIAGLVLQYSTGGARPVWTKLASQIQSGRPCGNGGAMFKGTAIAATNYAFYRITYLKQKIIDTTWILAASASKPVLAWKYADRITDFSVAPHSVANNGEVTVHGTLQYYFKTWHPFAHQVVMILVQPKGDTEWYWIVKVKTDAAGRFTATVKDYVGTAEWSAEYAGSATHLIGDAPEVEVTVS